jgi:hypothetical protein
MWMSDASFDRFLQHLIEIEHRDVLPRRTGPHAGPSRYHRPEGL